ncbi:ATP-binding protein [Actinophytocola sp. KF-1]
MRGTAVDDRQPPPLVMHLTGAGPEAVSAVRTSIRRFLSDLDEGDFPDVLVVAVELVTNALEHGGGPQWMRVSREQEAGLVRVEVRDSNLAPLTPGTSRFGVAAHRGNGLVLVGRMSADWGVDGDERTGCKTVWTTVPSEASA